MRHCTSFKPVRIADVRAKAEAKAKRREAAEKAARAAEKAARAAEKKQGWSLFQFVFKYLTGATK
jgi:hypothetical protein